MEQRTCAKCEFHYADDYDACPRCAARRKSKFALLQTLIWSGIGAVLSPIPLLVWMSVALFLFAVVMLIIQAFDPDFGLRSRLPGYVAIAPADHTEGAKSTPTQAEYDAEMFDGQ